MEITESKVRQTFDEVSALNAESDPDLEISGVSFLLEDGDTAWSPDGDPIEGPGSVAYRWTGDGFIIED